MKKFFLGERVWCVQTLRVMVQSGCDKCGGKAKFFSSDKSHTVSCPWCIGGSVSSGYKEISEVVGPLTIGQFEHTARNTIPNEHEKEEWTLDSSFGVYERVRYMMEETGIGSGTLWNENITFKSFKSAQEYIKSGEEKS